MDGHGVLSQMGKELTFLHIDRYIYKFSKQKKNDPLFISNKHQERN